MNEGITNISKDHYISRDTERQQKLLDELRATWETLAWRLDPILVQEQPVEDSWEALCPSANKSEVAIKIAKNNNSITRIIDAMVRTLDKLDI